MERPGLRQAPDMPSIVDSFLPSLTPPTDQQTEANERNKALIQHINGSLLQDSESTIREAGT